MGFRVAMAALNALEAERPSDEELVAIVENDSCAVDAIQVITGCTLGKGNLIFRDYGKQIYTFAVRDSGKAIRIEALRLNEDGREELQALRRKVFGGEATEEERQLYRKKVEVAVEEYLSAPLERVVRMKEVKCTLPEKARLFNSVTCALCGEKVMEPRARIKDGQPVCIPCADQYSRGW